MQVKHPLPHISSCFSSRLIISTICKNSCKATATTTYRSRHLCNQSTKYLCKERDSLVSTTLMLQPQPLVTASKQSKAKQMLFIQGLRHPLPTTPQQSSCPFVHCYNQGKEDKNKTEAYLTLLAPSFLQTLYKYLRHKPPSKSPQRSDLRSTKSPDQPAHLTLLIDTVLTVLSQHCSFCPSRAEIMS